jgi:hypothetical protein
MDSYCNEPVLVEKKLVQGMGHKHGVSFEMLSCVPSWHIAWPYCLVKTTLLGHEEQGQGPLHGIVDGRYP